MADERNPTGAIDISHIAGQLGDAKEVLRVFIPQGSEVVGGIFVDPHEQFSPFMFGMLLADLVHHGAKAYAFKFGLDEASARYEISQGLTAELVDPTDEARQFIPEASS